MNFSDIIIKCVFAYLFYISVNGLNTVRMKSIQFRGKSDRTYIVKMSPQVSVIL